MPSPSPAAVAMRRLRAQRREARLGSPISPERARLDAACYLYPILRTDMRASGKVWVRQAWEGRVQVGGRARVISRSVSRFGARGAYLLCLEQVAEWLLQLYPPEWVAAKVARLRAGAPPDDDLLPVQRSAMSLTILDI